MPVSVLRVLLCLGAWSFHSSFVKKEGKKEKKFDYVRAARKWRRKLCKLAAVLQGECTSVLVETEKNAHAQSNAVSFAVTIFLSGPTGSELRLFKNLSQSVRRRLTNLRFCEFFVCILSSLSSVFVGYQCRYRMSVSR